MNLILVAAAMAREAHDGQKRKYNGKPYVSHPARVGARYALRPDATEEGVAAGFLHDVIEDTKVTREDIAKRTNEAVAVLVEWMTNTSKITHPTANRVERKRIDRERLSKAPREVKILKMIDRIDNLSEMDGAQGSFVTVYVEESLLLAEAVGDADDLLRKELIDTAKALEQRGAEARA